MIESEKQENPDYTIRLYINPKMGKYFGPGLKNKILFNGTIQVGTLKYVFDLAPGNDFKQGIHKDNYDEYKPIILNTLSQEPYSLASDEDAYVAQIYLYSKADGKTPIAGLVFADINKQTILLFLKDVANDVFIHDEIDYHGCSSDKDGKRFPDFFASNFSHSVAASRIRRGSTLLLFLPLFRSTGWCQNLGVGSCQNINSIPVVFITTSSASTLGVIFLGE